MRRAIRRNWVLILFLIVTGVLVWVIGCPYLLERGYTGLCVFIYAVIVLVYVYGRAAVGPNE